MKHETGKFAALMRCGLIALAASFLGCSSSSRDADSRLRVSSTSPAGRFDSERNAAMRSASNPDPSVLEKSDIAKLHENFARGEAEDLHLTGAKGIHVPTRWGLYQIGYKFYFGTPESDRRMAYVSQESVNGSDKGYHEFSMIDGEGAARGDLIATWYFRTTADGIAHEVADWINGTGSVNFAAAHPIRWADGLQYPGTSVSSPTLHQIGSTWTWGHASTFFLKMIPSLPIPEARESGKVVCPSTTVKDVAHLAHFQSFCADPSCSRLTLIRTDKYLGPKGMVRQDFYYSQDAVRREDIGSFVLAGSYHLRWYSDSSGNNRCAENLALGK